MLLAPAVTDAAAATAAAASTSLSQQNNEDITFEMALTAAREAADLLRTALHHIQYHIVISVKICTNIFQNCLALLRADLDVQIDLKTGGMCGVLNPQYGGG